MTPEEQAIERVRAALMGYIINVNGLPGFADDVQILLNSYDKLTPDAQWISVEDRLPEEGQVAELQKREKILYLARYQPSENFYSPWALINYPSPDVQEGTFRRNASAVTHWRPVKE